MCKSALPYPPFTLEKAEFRRQELCSTSVVSLPTHFRKKAWKACGELVVASAFECRAGVMHDQEKLRQLCYPIT